MSTLKLTTDRGDTFEVAPTGEPRTFGRGTAAAVRVEDVALAREHFALRFADGRWWIEDLESPSGTFVNQTLVRQARVLAMGDEIRAGATVFRVGGA